MFSLQPPESISASAVTFFTKADMIWAFSGSDERSNASGEILAFHTSELVLLFPLSGAEIQHRVAVRRRPRARFGTHEQCELLFERVPFMDFHVANHGCLHLKSTRHTEGCSDEVAANNKEVM